LILGAPPSSDEFAKLSELDLLSLMKQTEEALANRKRASGVTLGDLFRVAEGKKRKARLASDRDEPGEVKPKFRDPESQET
jgi:hypothetical protein